MRDVFGQALLDYQSGKYKEDIITFSTVAGQDKMPLPYLFRNFEAMPAIEQQALKLCKGNVLDIGCGAGNHALYLQEKGLDVTGLDVSEGAISTCKLRGLKKTLNSTIYGLDGMKFDTLLLLMNGIGIAESLSKLDPFLKQLKQLLLPGGQVLLDSSDIIYMFDEEDIYEKTKSLIRSGQYYGEVTFTMEYKGYSSAPFQWLYLDYDTLKAHTRAHGWSCELVMEGEHYDYLARLSLGK
ncbi:class I SAM-dependent methyltransferase [Muriicola sp. Z0-33]|uniref:class I SAM-dependent methyltransferase n=1 Tax=Muriicola sp. Z0-33 TaxID=2816957 RepID=UPI0022387BE9|nr:class I SAM-dependent methyltransferase [Muriicola sp. Z0-33]MCW5516848.1 class I SAM-dependent methyltransferase [Muriicola sp. Z0-33]